MENFNIRKKPTYTIISQPCNHFSSQFELDTLRMTIDRHTLSQEQLKNLIQLSKAKTIRKGCFEGQYKNFHININDFTITVTGSPSNYYVGDDRLLPYNDLYKAIDKLSSELKLNLHSAHLYRIDINFNIINKPFIKQLSHHLFVDMPRWKRLEQDRGVTFKTKSNTLKLVFYSKSLQLSEVKSKKVDEWYRIEFGILYGVKKWLGIKYVNDLYKQENYIRLIEMLIERYFQVRKQRVSRKTFDISGEKPKLKYTDFIMIQGVESYGVKNIYRDIEQLSQLGHFKNRNQKSRLRRKFSELSKNELITETNPIVKKLDEELMGAYYYELSNLKNNSTYLSENC